jgi:branched-chain amino acid aminotransferase
MMQPFTPLPKETYTRGVAVITAELTRHDPRLKDTSFIFESQSARSQVGNGVYEILLTKAGAIYEGMTSNFYAVNPAGELITARNGILLGVTRRAVLRLARGQGMPVQYRSPKISEIFSEAFLTSSSRGVVPIVKMDGVSVGQGTPGVWTKILISAYTSYVTEKSELLDPGGSD